MEVVNLRCDGHYSGSNPDRRVKPTSRVFVVYDFILYEFSDLFYSLIISISLSSLIFLSPTWIGMVIYCVCENKNQTRAPPKEEVSRQKRE